MADKVPVGDPLGGLPQLLQALGGTRTTQSTNAGDTAALTQLISQLQGTDYNKLLEAVFQQAAGAIPGFQAAYGNAVGARSTGNSAVQAALNKLLTQAAIQGQSQIADQQLRNAQIQAQAGGSIAQATRGTQQTQKSGTNLGQAATMIAGLQLLGKARGLFEDDGVFGKIFGGNGGGQGGAGAVVTPIGGATAFGSDLPGMDMDAYSQDVFAPTPLPVDFDQPLDLEALFGTGDTTGMDFSGIDWSQFDNNNADLGGWTDPMLDESIDWSF
jgi:hypothetical protein